MVRTKVFVGNLSFKTGEKELAKEFEVAGKVASANIISRGARSLGYGFVEMESEEEARKAVELLNKKLIDNREINVEVARPREEGDNANGSNNAEGAPAAGGRRRGTGRRFPKRRTNAPAEGDAPAGNNNNNNNAASSSNAKAPSSSNGAPTGGRGGRRGRGGRFSRGGRGGGAPRAERADRTIKVAPPNSVFVANLPFKLTDQTLADVFTNLSLKEPVKASHVVKDRMGFSKGYGFVEFANAEDQQKALSADKTQVETREISVKAAFTEAPAKVESPAPVEREVKA